MPLPPSALMIGAFSCILALSGGAAGCAARAERPELPKPERVSAVAPAASKLLEPAPTVRFHHRGAEWCMHGGSALVGQPVLDERGRVYVVTADGYLHAFERDGRYRFSYTVKGTPLGRVSLRPTDGAILVGTTKQLVYAITQRGGLSWSFRTITPVWSGLHPLDERTVIFLGLDQHLYALSNTGAARYRVPVPGEPTGEPVVASEVVWIPLADGIARIDAAREVQRIAFDSPVEQVVALPDGVAALSAGQLWRVSADGQKQRLGPAEYLAGDGERAVALSGAGGGWWLERGDNERWAPLQTLAGVSGAPAWNETALVFPKEDGSLWLVDRSAFEAFVRGEGESPRGRRIVAAARPIASVQLSPSGEPSGESESALVTLDSSAVCSVFIGSQKD